jgi:RHS repeat-associated protein
MTSDGTYTYTWDAESRMQSGAGVTYTYDGDGRRVMKSNGTLFWYGTGNDPLLETDLSGGLQNEYIFLQGKRIARRNASSGVYYYFADHLGTAQTITDQQGNLCYDADFYPYGGERTPILDTCDSAYKFTGKERDSESGLDMFGARYYGSSLGRFMTPDWAAKPTAVPYAYFGDPQSLNLYSYVGNNPLKRADPDGHCPSDNPNCGKMQNNPVANVSPEVKQAINNSVKASNSPTADDKKGGSHEEGGVAYTKNGAQVVAPAQPGKYQDVKTLGEAKIDPFKAANASQQKPGDVKADVEWHVHPSASVTETTGSQSAPGTVVFGGTTTTTTYQFNQPPSGVDIQEAGAANLSLVIGARDKTVYVYDSSGVTCQESLKDFNKTPNQ